MTTAMSLRIGGELEILPSSLLGPKHDYVPSIERPHLIKLNTGRAALRAALEDILQRGGTTTAWVPAYICPSVVNAFLSLGFETKFYSINKASDESMQQRFPDLISKGDTFLYVHYFGIRNHWISNWLKTQESSRDFYVVEDCVQASLNSNVGEVGNYAITSYRKFLPQPDGAFLFSQAPLNIPLAEPDEYFVSSRFLGKSLKCHPIDDVVYLALFSEAERRIEHDFMPRKMSWLSAFIMDLTDIPSIIEKRIANWKLLCSFLEDHRLIGNLLSPIYDNLSLGDVPLGFPVKVEDGKRDKLRRYLSERHIYCPIHWALSHLNDSDEWNTEKNLSQSILTLPLDQRLEEEHLEYMVQTLDSFVEEEGLYG